MLQKEATSGGLNGCMNSGAKAQTWCHVDASCRQACGNAKDQILKLAINWIHL